jgi:septal ring factor EnvC (AmiA/AmiB activator)
MATDDLQASVQLHIQAQEEIKQELLATISALERESRPPRTTLKQVHFHSASLRHVVADKSVVLDQIAKFKSVILPDLQQQLHTARQKRDLLESRIAALQASRSDALMANLDDPTRVLESISEFSQRLQNEIDELAAAEAQLKQNTATARVELRALQDQSLNRQREKSKQTLADEISDERQLFGTAKGRRKRSSTVVAGLQAGKMDRKLLHPNPSLL